jgi:inosine-uridine nucleoside N-ribohydrolase
MGGLTVAGSIVAGTSTFGATPDVAAEKIIIDTDIGTDIDDAFAVALALRSPEVTLLGVSTVSGETSARARILDRMLGESGYSKIPVAVGTPTTLLPNMPSIGRQGRFGEKSRFAAASHQSAVEFMLEQIRRFPGEITLVTIGPLTNVAQLIDEDAQTFRRLKRVVMMGGSIRWDEGVGRTVDKPTPEYNILVDSAAAKKLFSEGVPIYVMPLDATAQLKLDEVKRDELFARSTPLTDSLALLYLLWGYVTPILYDAMAVGYVVNPGLCPVQPMHIVIDENGVTRSETGEPNAEVCLRSDPEAFFHFYMGRFQQ